MTHEHPPSPDGQGDAHEAALRKRLRERALTHRQAMPAERRAQLTLRIARHLDELVARLQPDTLGFCWPYRAEPDLRDWVQGWLAARPGRAASLPVVLERHAPMTFRAWTPGVPMPLDRHGIPHPTDGVEVQPELVLVPLNAFDDHGYRIGYGGGYFDRTLAVMRTVAVGVGFEAGRVPDTFPQPHDRPMQWLVTEAGAFETRPRNQLADRNMR